MWHVSSRSGVATLRTAIHLLLTYLLSYIVCSDAEIYRLRHEEHAALVERLRSSIEAHIHLLTKVRTSGVTYNFWAPRQAFATNGKVSMQG